MKMGAAAVLSAALLELPFPLAGPMPPWRSIFAWFGLVPLLWAILSPATVNHPRPLRRAFLLAYLVRRPLVHGQLLLDPRHHDAIRRHAHRRTGIAAHRLQPCPRSLLRIVRPGRNAGSPRNWEVESRTRCSALSLGHARPRSRTHHQRSVGSTRLFASGQRDRESACSVDRRLRD